MLLLLRFFFVYTSSSHNRISLAYEWYVYLYFYKFCVKSFRDDYKVFFLDRHRPSEVGLFDFNCWLFNQIILQLKWYQLLLIFHSNGNICFAPHASSMAAPSRNIPMLRFDSILDFDRKFSAIKIRYLKRRYKMCFNDLRGCIKFIYDSNAVLFCWIWIFFHNNINSSSHFFLFTGLCAEGSVGSKIYMYMIANDVNRKTKYAHNMYK